MLSMLWLTMMSVPKSVILSNSFPALEEAAAAAGVPRISFCFDLFIVKLGSWLPRQAVCCCFWAVSAAKKIYCGTPKRFFVG